MPRRSNRPTRKMPEVPRQRVGVGARGEHRLPDLQSNCIAPPMARLEAEFFFAVEPAQAALAGCAHRVGAVGDRWSSLSRGAPSEPNRLYRTISTAGFAVPPYGRNCKMRPQRVVLIPLLLMLASCSS